MSTALSLFDELTRQTGKTFPVTDVLTKLLQTVGHDVSLTKRNLHSSYWTVSRARDLCDTINELAAKAGDGDSWEAFDKYTAMIVSLEQILLDFSLVAETESAASKLPTANTIQNDLVFIDSWRINRKALHETNDNAGNLSDIKAIHRHDDSVLLRGISNVLRDHTGNMSTPEASKSFSAIQSQLDGLQTTLALAPVNLSDDVVVYSMQTAMIIEIVASARDSQLADRLQSPELWTRATTLVNVVEKHSKDVKLAVEPLEKAWTDFCSYLTAGVIAELPGTYKDLRTLISKIRRPYYAQSLALIHGCVELAPIFNGKKTFAMLSPLNLAVDNTTKALTAAAGVVYDPTIGVPRNEDVSSALDTARESVKKCFAHYKLDPGPFEHKFIKARDTDNSRLALLEARFKSKPPIAAVKQQPIQVVVTVSDPAAKQTVKTYSVEPSTMLSAILWKEASLRPLKQANELRSKGFFRAGVEKPGLDTEIGKLPEKSGKRSVTLVIPP
ncbi:hypothetical protein B0H17DRAFT_1127687 [Mycena rosella]|uniref:Uncharacterized protein n=1 Tax=Mycena rosella TaxID=1033263 RepID=A0AAD7E0Z5_MYCRO|nr:hypothetical protein B0H17DRAFT_1127687 [Mycena rosella]